jgi:hypothetical protein
MWGTALCSFYKSSLARADPGSYAIPFATCLIRAELPLWGRAIPPVRERVVALLIK